MKLSYLILIGFVVILLMFAAATYINFRQSEKVTENSEFFSTSTIIVRQTNRFQRNILSMISGLRGYLLTGENYFIESYDSAANENVVILQELGKLIPKPSQQEAELKQIIELNQSWVDEYAIPLINAKRAAITSDSAQQAYAQMYRERYSSGREPQLNRRLQLAFRDFANYQYNLRDIRRVELDDAIQRTRKISFYLTSASIVLGLAIAIFLAKRISTRVMRMVKMADKIADGQYDVYTEDRGNDEISRLTESLNRMARVLSENITLLQRKNDELGQFAHIVSHDLKAPLRGIDNVVTWIEEDHDDELTPKMKEYIRLIKGRLVRAENLIQGILMYARVGREMPEKEHVNLEQLLQETLENVAPNRKHTIVLPKHLPTIYAEKIPLQQVLTNLISNAVKYNNRDEGIVTVKFAENDRHYQFRVEDNGPGIDKNYHEKIFQIFQTLHERDSFESTGVGLAIVKKILDDRKQSIQVVSAPGKGAAFTFTWPKAVEEPELLR